MYSCSTPTEPGGKVVFTIGSVDCAGGIVAKSVGPTGTTVVAVPDVSVLQAAINSTMLNIAAEADSAECLLAIIVPKRTPSFALRRVNTTAINRYASCRAEAVIGAGKVVEPIRNLSTAEAVARPSAIAHTIRLWPRPMSPATKTPRTFV